MYFTYNSNPAKFISFSGKIGPRWVFYPLTNDRYEKSTFGGAAEAGIQLRMDRNLFLIAGVRFDADFTNAEDKEYASYPAGRAKTYNMTGGLEVGFKYNFL